MLLAACTSCSSAGYLAREAVGGLSLQFHKRPILKILADESTSPELREQLGLVLAIREFASEELYLPDNGSYRSYRHLDRQYASWTVSATPELSLEPVEWCFPVAGCVTYRGYFSHSRALEYARRLEASGKDVDVGGVRAFSTIGWFKDPVLSTFVGLPPAQLAGLLFHELAHQRVYVKDDTTFNESFASVVEMEGVARWLRDQGKGEELADYQQHEDVERRFVELLGDFRRRLAAVYAAEERDDDWKRARKAEILTRLRTEHVEMRSSDDAWHRYDAWFERPLNNARLAAVGEYEDLAPAFRRLLEDSQGDLHVFYQSVEKLAGETRDRRLRLMSVGGEDSPL